MHTNIILCTREKLTRIWDETFQLNIKPINFILFLMISIWQREETLLVIILLIYEFSPVFSSSRLYIPYWDIYKYYRSIIPWKGIFFIIEWPEFNAVYYYVLWFCVCVIVCWGVRKWGCFLRWWVKMCRIENIK